MPSEKKPSRKQGILRIIYAGKYSLSGIIQALKSETAFQQEIILCIILSILLFFVSFPFPVKLILALVQTLIPIIELLNSALESIVDFVSPEFHPFAKKAKDFGSAAVFIALFLTTILWISALLYY